MQCNKFLLLKHYNIVPAASCPIQQQPPNDHLVLGLLTVCNIKNVQKSCFRAAIRVCWCVYWAPLRGKETAIIFWLATFLSALYMCSTFHVLIVILLLFCVIKNFWNISSSFSAVSLTFELNHKLSIFDLNTKFY